jgi:predicted Fe-Mo cluster-binding NifX family protein
MKLAVPVWGNRVSPVLDSATRLLIIEVKGQRELSRSETALDETGSTRRCRRIQNLGVEALICGAVTRRFADMLGAFGVFVIPGVAGPPDEVLRACLEKRLNHPKYLMPGWSLDGLSERLRHLSSGRAQK